MHFFQTLQLLIRYGLHHRSGTLCLYTVHLALWIQLFNDERDTGNQTASANRYDNRIRIFQLLHNLHADGSLTGHNIDIIERMNKNRTALFLILQCSKIRIVINTVNHPHFRAVISCRLYFRERGNRGKENGRLCTGFCCGQSYTLCMISC